MNPDHAEPGSEPFSVLDPAVRTLDTGDLRAVFLPGQGMVGASLRHRRQLLPGPARLTVK
jgi:hypothetical protein